ncbi:site-specific integrase [Streptomyces sp. STCH 565 A]|uniref:tyrosine-type recombinase/integrase n=1 Tax=Streptomyces sp. STCH 565 A TaxID=2950532 RepID=UPI002076435C|nr:site-specific integrase [Streptomyces sp. STCH 565 A]MCM8551597.1 site-specific integrase [Streptomyces sp. STCH 565 A]
MTVIHAVVSAADSTADELADPLREAIRPEFLQLMGWDPQVRLLFIPRDHPQFSAPECLVAGCDKMVYYAFQQGLCVGCMKRWNESGQSIEEFASTAKRYWRAIGETACTVPQCARPSYGRATPLCSTHLYQQKRIYKIPVEEFVQHPDVVPLEAFGPCFVAACYRQRESPTGYCPPHAQRRRKGIQKGTLGDEDHWRRTTSAVAQNGVISLRGLPDRVVHEILYGLQERVREGALQKDYLLRPFCDRVRSLQVTTLSELDLSSLSSHAKTIGTGFLKHLGRFGLTPETERHKDIWSGYAFGLEGNIYFDKISQFWLREATKAWALDDIPKRRGKTRAIVQSHINAIAQLSDSLRLNRLDHGEDARAVARDDVTIFLNRLRFLNEQGEISGYTHVRLVRHVRRLLSRMRTLGLTQRDQPLHGICETFGLRAEDVPDDPEDNEAGKDLPAEVMTQLCQHLDGLEATGAREIRTAVELLIDTGRRPAEICRLPYDCLERDEDGKLTLIYDNHKSARKARRLPISGETGALIIAQQERVRARFPNTPTDSLKLLPSMLTNTTGTKPITPEWLAGSHRSWVKSLPEFLVPTVVTVKGRQVTKTLPFDKAKIFPYAYRHTYAQRHADAGVAPDALQSLMDHRQLTTTQQYYRVGETRKREAVERVTAMQFDRNGNRVWRKAQALLDSEHARRAIGEVQVPYGLCTEPTNVQAGGHDCPVRFRCVGCDHFRTDVSYLPDLEAYLADLLRGRERLAAFAADSWAKAEAMPSDEEITRVRRLVKRVREDLEDLTEEDRIQIKEAVTMVRRTRRIVSLGLPRVGPPEDLRPERPAG